MPPTPAADDQQFPRAFYVIVPLAVSLLALLLVELALSLFFPTPFASEHNLYFLPDPYTGFRPRPESEGQYASGVVAHINRHGHRSDDVALEKPAGTLRVMVLGDSFTIGANVEQAEGYADILQQLLRERLEAPLEVINTGIGAWGPFQYAQYFEHYGLFFEPDLVVVGFFVGNDTFQQVDRIELTRTAVGGRRIERGEEPDAPHFGVRLNIFLYERSQLYRRLLNRRAFVPRKEHLRDRGQPRDTGELTESYLAVQRNRMRKNHRPWSAATEERAAISLEQIERIQRLTEAREIGLLVVLLPDENQVNGALFELVSEPEKTYDLEMPQTLLAARLGELGIDVLDLLPAFRNDERRLYMDDSHWTPAGHRLAATLIADALEPRLPAVPRTD